MFARVAISSVLVASGIAAELAPTPVVVESAITPGPQVEFELFRKQNNLQYIGWRQWSGIWTTRTCNLGGTYYATSSYWRCCGTELNGCPSTQIPTGCVDGSLIYPVVPTGTNTATDTTRACTSIFTSSAQQTHTACNILRMFENEGDTSALINYNCGESSIDWTYFRNQPQEAKQTSDLSSLNPSNTSPQSVSASVTSSSSSSPTVIPPPGDESGGSKAWIAGAVVGPLLGLALVGFLVWFFLRRRKRNQNSNAPADGNAPAGYSQPSSYYAPMQQQEMGSPGVVPYKDTHSPGIYGNASPNPQAAYVIPGQQQQQYNQGQPVYEADSTGMGYAQPTQHENGVYKHTAQTERPFSSELEADSVHPNMANVQPRTQ